MDKESYFMEVALQEAKKAFNKNEVPVGAVIVCDGKIVAKAHNLKEELNTATAHAEILAINTASSKLNNWRLEDCVLYVTLEPCAMCASAIVQSRINKVVIGALDNKEGAVITSKHIFENNHNHKLFVKTGILKDDCEKIINLFMSQNRGAID